MERAIFGLLFISIAIIGVLVSGSFAFQSAEVVRDSNISIEQDPNAVVSITPSSQYDIVSIDSTGQLSISPANVGANSYNENMLLQIGDPANPTTDFAFTLNSLKQQQVTYTFSLEQQASYSSTADSVTLTIADAAGNTQTITADGTGTTFTLQPNEQLYVVVQYDTQGEASGNLNTNLIIEMQSN